MAPKTFNLDISSTRGWCKLGEINEFIQHYGKI